MNRVNIILASYNGEKFLQEQINSILKSKYKNWKLWIFDDGSTDKTVTIAENYSKEYPDKIIFHANESNKGVTLNFLEGVIFAAAKDSMVEEHKLQAAEITESKDYYMFCDQDDVWKEEKIEKTLKYMKKLEKQYGEVTPLAVFTDANVVDEQLELIHPSFFKSGKLNVKALDLPHILMENKLIGCTVMINIGLLDKLKELPGRVRYHDWWVALVASAFGHIGYFDEPTLLYRQHSRNVVGNESFLNYVKGRIKELYQQKAVIDKTILQAQEFYRIYQKELAYPKKMQVYAFTQINRKNWFSRRILVIKYGFFKTGLIRNLGLMWVL